MKLFFIATGLETEADVEEFGRLLTRLRRSAPRCRIITSFTPLFNAPFTPLQFEEIRDIPAALARALEATARSAGAEFRWSASPAEVGLMNLLCRAGRAATATLVHLSIEKGFRYFDHVPDAALDAALKHVEASGIAIAHLAAARKESEVLPWDDLEAGANRNKLWRSFKKAAADWENPPEQLAEAETSPMRLVKLPLPSLAPRELAWWVEIPRENADHPDITIARGLLRNVLQASEAVTRAYSGPLTLVRPNGAFGIALLSAEFKGLTVNPDASFDAASVDPSQFLYLVRLTDKSFDHFAEMLHGRRVSFQTVHHDDHRWLVVGKTFRHRCGITAAGEVAEGMIVFCGSQAGEQVRGGEVLAAYGRSETKCPRCGAKTLNLLKGSAPAGVPECPDCLVK